MRKQLFRKTCGIAAFILCLSLAGCSGDTAENDPGHKPENTVTDETPDDINISPAASDIPDVSDIPGDTDINDNLEEKSMD